MPVPLSVVLGGWILFVGLLAVLFTYLYSIYINISFDRTLPSLQVSRALALTDYNSRCKMSPQEPHSLVREIERQISRVVGIEAVECTSALSKCHPQDHSPIFANLPREIRQFIWEYATAPYEDERHPYEKNEYYYRPGHTARIVSDTNLLLTCRRIWLEANALPMLQAEHCFWYYRAAPDARSPEWMAGLTNLNRANFGHLHLFAQMFAIERLTCEAGRLRNYFLRSSPQKADFQPRILHVTIRYVLPLAMTPNSMWDRQCVAYVLRCAFQNLT